MIIKLIVSQLEKSGESLEAIFWSEKSGDLKPKLGNLALGSTGTASFFGTLDGMTDHIFKYWQVDGEVK